MDERSPPLGDLALYLWRLSRPEVWYFSLVPLYVGYVLASHELLPGADLGVEFLDRTATEGSSPAQFVALGQAWLRESWRFLVACLAFGPILWTATLLINDVHDLAGDRLNPRKARSPLVQGLVNRGQAHFAAYVFAGLTLVVAFPIGPTFFLLTGVCVALAWAYSVPPLRLKTVPGADVAVNVFGAGVVGGLAGWSLAAPLSEAPYAFLPQALLVGTAIYIPTALVDFDADRQAGYRTIATAVGRRTAFQIGWWCWVAANVGSLLLSWNAWIIPRAMFPFLAVLVPVLLAEYWFLIGNAKTPSRMLAGITVCSATFLAVNAIFALMYVGWWV